MDYPVWDLAIGGGMLMALVAVPHVIVAHFAVGGGFLIALAETLGVRKGDAELRDLAKRSSLMLILVSTVFGAISGVGIWVVAGLISPGAISSLIHNYVWGWAMEWVFFFVEIVAALVYYATWDRISKKAHVFIGWVYFVGAYGSLLIINGILTFQLTPGSWLETHAFWTGFFNPTYWPATVLRTGIVLMMAGAFMLFPAAKAGEAAPRLIRFLGKWFVGGSLVAYAGYRWWEAQLGEGTRALFLGPDPILPSLAATKSWTLWSLTAALLVAVILLIGLPKIGRKLLPSALVLLLAFSFFAGYERLREGARKPFLIHSHQFSNGLLIDDIERINDQGLAAYSGWVGIGDPEDAVARGANIFKIQCASCHTMNGYHSITEALPTFDEMVAVAADEPRGAGAATYAKACAPCHEDTRYEEMTEFLMTADEMREDPAMTGDFLAGMIAGTLDQLRSMGTFYLESDRTAMINTHETAYPMMPPFVGNDDDLEALAAYLATLTIDGGDSGTTGGVQ